MNSVFPSWVEGSPALRTLTDYVARVTDPGSPAFIPEARRIAAIDFDGTIFCEEFPAYEEWLMFIRRVTEDASYTPDPEVAAFADRLKREIEAGNQWQPDTLSEHARLAARAFAGMTVREYRDYCRAFLDTPAEGFSNLLRKDAFYRPMVEVMRYLQDNGFDVYIVSATDRDMVRVNMEGLVDARHIIGMDVFYEASGQRGADGLNYVYTRGADTVVRSDRLIVKTDRMNKVSQMVQELYDKPVLAFGNSFGDESMLLYVTDGNDYEALAFCVLADDPVREYGSREKGEAARAHCREMGYVPISMAEEFKTIYGPEVQKTGKPGRD